MPDFECLERLGAGNFGEVWLVHDRALGVERAVKYIRASRIADPTEFYKEPQILMALRHKSIVRVEDAGPLDGGGLYIAMEYLPKGSVADAYRGRPVSLRKARKILCDVCWGLAYAHQRGFIHRDIKPGNILLTDAGDAKLSDFGLATRAPRGIGASPYGYLTHLAPEVLTSGATTVLTDIYALGVTAYRLVNGDSFLPGFDTDEDFIGMVVAGKYPDRTRYRPMVPRSVRQLINRAIHINPEKRFQSAEAFRSAWEAQHFHCDWRWKRKKEVVTYNAKVEGAKLRVTVDRRDDGGFHIITTKQLSGGLARQVRAHCAKDLTLAEMKAFLHNVLSHYVLHGR